ncbi:hypothetical protein LTS10_010350 [Elasticomyces elasticus]|nr:hypothetical protein LTS10_010350 [Elasticomyces elasticus]
MPAPKRLAGKLPSIKFPALAANSRYNVFVSDFFRIPQDLDTLRTIKKETLDGSYEALIRERFKADEGSATTYMREIQSPDAQQQWQEAWDATRLRQLNLPTLTVANPRWAGDAHSKTEMGRQNYRDFALKTQKLNPEIELTKEIVDRAFDSVASKFAKQSREKGNPKVNRTADIEKMIKRCLGEESDKYWSR